MTNAVDLNVGTASFSRIMDSTATNAQIAFNQIDTNAAKTSEVVAVDTQADSIESAFLSFKSATETADASQDVKINSLDIAKTSNETTLASHDHSILNLQAAVSGISTNQTVNVTAGENLTSGDVVSLINSYGTVTAKKNNLTVNTSPNGAERVFNSATTSYIYACALDTTRFIVSFKDGVDSKCYSIVGTVSGSSIS